MAPRTPAAVHGAGPTRPGPRLCGCWRSKRPFPSPSPGQKGLLLGRRLHTAGRGTGLAWQEEPRSRSSLHGRVKSPLPLTRRRVTLRTGSQRSAFTSGRWLSAEAPAAAGPLTPALLQEAAVSALGALCSESCAQAPGQAGPAGLGEWPRPRAGACACGSRHGHPCAQSTASRGRPGHPVPASWQAAWCGSASQSSGARRRPRAAASRWPWAPFPPPC